VEDCAGRKPVIGDFPEKAAQLQRSASQENCLNVVNHTGVCKYGLRWPLAWKNGCDNSFLELPQFFVVPVARKSSPFFRGLILRDNNAAKM